MDTLSHGQNKASLSLDLGAGDPCGKHNGRLGVFVYSVVLGK